MDTCQHTTSFNRLIKEKSPYLLQHATNPVAWYPWGEEAFATARREDKPIFLSIGYSTCHWCHVMAHESFEDPEIASLMNQVFISVKVDREERPDLDTIYMKVCQMLTGSGGWPLTIIMTPDQRPFFAATYLPPDNRKGRIGLRELIRRIQTLWTIRRGEIFHFAQEIALSLTRDTHISTDDELLDEPILTRTYCQLKESYDSFNGGFGRAPKFPTPHNLYFLLRYWRRYGDVPALTMVEKTLKAMRRGGIYDHLGYGFHRYSTDPEWRLPHFEKMLYDQALMSIAYIEAFQATGNKEYEETAKEIFTYVKRELTSPQGGFYSAEDADSGGREGSFYLWNRDEIARILTKEEAELADQVFSLEQEGNVVEESTGRKTGENILYLRAPLVDLASSLHLSLTALQVKLAAIRKKLFQVREQRVHPHKDDKILTDWNGLMIAALAKGARAFNNPSYAEDALKALECTITHLSLPEGRLLHRFRDGQAAIPALLDDYAFFTWGLLELYDATFDVTFLEKACELTSTMVTLFWDERQGGFYHTPTDGENVLIRLKELYDGALPSGNSVALLNMLRLSRITGCNDFEEKAVQLIRAFSSRVKQYPSAYTQFVSALDFFFGPSCEVIIVGAPHTGDTARMIGALRERFLPNTIILFKPTFQDTTPLTRLAPHTKELCSRDERATAYVCRNQSCFLPTHDPSTMLAYLG